MHIRSFNQAISSAFALPDTITKLIKTALISSCSDVDRYFRVTFNADIYEQVNETKFNEIKRVFPNFAKLSLEQFNRLLFTFVKIRDVAAHLFLNKEVYIDEDIEDFIKGIINPPYAITNGKEATLFGAICIVSLLSQGYQLYSLVTGIVRHNIFVEVSKSELAQFQRNFQKTCNALIGLGKPCRPVKHLFFTDTDITFFNEEIKKTLTRLIFDFEEHSSPNQKMSSTASNIKILLNKYSSLRDKPDLVDRIYNLRNYWLHGYRLFDTVKTGDKEFVFNFDYLFDLLLDIKSSFSGMPHSYEILNDINSCGSSMIDFYTLRSVEISYKLLDSAVFDEAKTLERINNSLKAYRRCMTPEPWFYDKAKLLMRENKTWYLSANKFIDKLERVYKADKIEIFEFSSNSGFDIGDAHFSIDEMVLTNIECPEARQLKIDGKFLEEYKKGSPETFGIFDIYTIQL